MFIMKTEITTVQENKTLDLCKFIASIFIAATHLPSFLPTEATEIYFTQWFSRFCVPFFFLSTGYFFQKALDKRKSLKRIAWLFALSYMLYLPAILEGATDVSGVISKLRWNLIIGYEHLWYLSATLEGLLVWYVLEKIPVISDLFRKIGIPLCICLFLIGALLDEHYRLLDSNVLQSVGDFVLIFGGPRNVVFMGFPLLYLGGSLARYEKKLRKVSTVLLVLGWFLFRGAAFWECGYLYGALGPEITNDITFFGCWPAVFLFLLSIKFQIPIPEQFAKLLRKLSEYIYILHPLVAMLITHYLPLTPLSLWLSTITMCSLLYILLEKQFVSKKQETVK